jgi:hypothetical protein
MSIKFALKMKNLIFNPENTLEALKFSWQVEEPNF